MAYDIFDDNNGVINQNADGKDQGKQGNAIQGIAVEIKDQQGQCEGRRDGQHDHNRLTKTEKKQDQQRDTENSYAHVQQQLIRLFRRRFTIISRHTDLQIGRNQRPFKAVNFCFNFVNYVYRVGPGPLGHRQGHRRFFSLPGLPIENISIRLLRPINNLSDIIQIHRPAAIDPNNDPSDLCGRAEKLTGLQQNLMIK